MVLSQFEFQGEGGEDNGNVNLPKKRMLVWKILANRDIVHACYSCSTEVLDWLVYVVFSILQLSHGGKHMQIPYKLGEMKMIEFWLWI